MTTPQQALRNHRILPGSSSGGADPVLPLMVPNSTTLPTTPFSPPTTAMDRPAVPEGSERSPLWRRLGARTSFELAGGTGLYTKSLAALADRLTVVDASPESLAINLSGLEPGSDVTFVEADIFEWDTPQRYDVVVFAFWLSHVPLDLFDQFWLLVESCLESDGTVVVIDASS